MHLSPAAKDAAISLLDTAGTQLSGDILETGSATQGKPVPPSPLQSWRHLGDRTRGARCSREVRGASRAPLADAELHTAVHRSSGSSFGLQRWTTRQGGIWEAQKWLAGDFNSDGKDDLAKVFDDAGLSDIDVHKH